MWRSIKADDSTTPGTLIEWYQRLASGFDLCRVQESELDHRFHSPEQLLAW